MKVKEIAVIGSGIMGSGIALTCALSSYNVVIQDVNRKIIEQAFSRMTSILKTLVEIGFITEKKQI